MYGAGFGKSGVTETPVGGIVVDCDFACGLAPGSTSIASDVICRRRSCNRTRRARGSTLATRRSAGVQDGHWIYLVHAGDLTLRNCQFAVTESAEAAEANR